MPKTIRVETIIVMIFPSKSDDHDSIWIIKQLVTASVVYTKDVILSAVTTDYENNLARILNLLDLHQTKQQKMLIIHLQYF